MQELFHYRVVEMTFQQEHAEREAAAQRSRLLAQARASETGRVETRERRPSRFGLARLLPSL